MKRLLFIATMLLAAPAAHADVPELRPTAQVVSPLEATAAVDRELAELPSSCLVSAHTISSADPAAPQAFASVSESRSHPVYAGLAGMLALACMVGFGLTTAPSTPATPGPGPSPGSQTSEFSLTKYVTIFGMVLTALGTVLASVASVLPASSKAGMYVGIAIAVIGALMKIAVVLGYQVARTNVKVAAIEQQGAQVQADTEKQAGASNIAAAEALK